MLQTSTVVLSLLLGPLLPADEFKSGLQVGDRRPCLQVIWLVNWPYEKSFQGCLTCTISPAAPVAAVFTRTVDDRVAELVLALDLQVTDWESRGGPRAFVCGVGGLEHEDLAPLKKAAKDVALTIPGRRKAAQDQLTKYKLNEQAAVTVIVYDDWGKVTANFAFRETKELTRPKIREIVKEFAGSGAPKQEGPAQP